MILGPFKPADFGFFWSTRTGLSPKSGLSFMLGGELRDIMCGGYGCLISCVRSTGTNCPAPGRNIVFRPDAGI